MGNVSFSLNEFMSCLSSIPPLELKGMGLLREQPHLLGGFAHISRPQLVAAVQEIVAYTERCAAAMRQVSSLAPVPLLTVSVLEFGL